MHRVVPGTESTTSPVRKVSPPTYATRQYAPPLPRLKSSWDFKATYDTGKTGKDLPDQQKNSSRDPESKPGAKEGDENYPEKHERHSGVVASAADSARALAQRLEKGLLARVLGHHREEHDKRLEAVRDEVIRERHVNLKGEIEVHKFGYFGDHWLQHFLVAYFYSHKNPVGGQVHEYKMMQHHLLIHPMSHFRSFWDAMLIIFVFFTSIMLPVEIAFFQQEDKQIGFLVATQVLVDVVFALDVVLNYNTSLYGHTAQLERSRLKIARAYTFGWGVVDIPACLPFEQFYTWFAKMDKTVDNHNASELRYLALLKMPRLLRFGRVLKWLENFEFASAWRIIRLLLSFLLIAHWSGCVLYLLSEAVQDDPATSYTFQNGISDRFHQIYPNFLSQYITCFHSAFLLILGENVEFEGKGMKTFAITVMFAGAVLNSILFGQMAMLLQNMNRAGNLFQAKLDSVNEFMRNSHLSHDLKERVHQYVEYQWKSSRVLNREGFLRDLSYPLYKEINLMLHGHLINSVPLFKDVDADCMVMLTCSLKPIVFLPNDFIIREGQVGTQMYFLRIGQCKVTCDKMREHVLARLHTGDYFGETGVLSMNALRRANVIAETHCDMYVLTSQKFQDIVRTFPSAGQMIRENLEKKMKNEDHSGEAGTVDSLHKRIHASLKKLRMTTRIKNSTSAKKETAVLPQVLSPLPKGSKQFSSMSRIDNQHDGEEIDSFSKGALVASRREIEEMRKEFKHIRLHMDHKFFALATALRIPTRQFDTFKTPQDWDV